MVWEHGERILWNALSSYCHPDFTAAIVYSLLYLLKSWEHLKMVSLQSAYWALHCLDTIFKTKSITAMHRKRTTERNTEYVELCSGEKTLVYDITNWKSFIRHNTKDRRKQIGGQSVQLPKSEKQPSSCWPFTSMFCFLCFNYFVLLRHLKYFLFSTIFQPSSANCPFQKNHTHTFKSSMGSLKSPILTRY